MPRLARTVIPGLPHHITQRGNNKQDIFFVDNDRKVYLEILAKQSAKYSLTVIGYCLMGNHIHLVAIPAAEDSLAKAVGGTHFAYSQHINRFHNRSGHLWQGRFYSCVLDDHHFLSAMRYIERNPVKAGLCRKPWDYRWSSAAVHTKTGSRSDLLDLRQWYNTVRPDEWEKLLTEEIDDKEAENLRTNTYTGRPLGSDSFISKIEETVGFRLRPLPVGRPKK
jgi:putative transposase